MSELSKVLRCGRSLAFRLLLLAAIATAASALPQSVAAQPVRGEISVTVENGYARFVLQFAEEIRTQVRLANNILVINFQKPVNMAVERIGANSAGYVVAARRDPDGMAIRLALARKVTVNSVEVAERLFVDLLPESWTGMPPGLPREVIEELARRALNAEKKNRQRLALERQRPDPLVRVRVAMQPTFTRYVFDLPELTAVTAESGKDELTLTFGGAYKFDLADAVAALPPMVGSIRSEVGRESAIVRFDFSGKVDVRTFREDNSYVLDVSVPDAKAQTRSDAQGVDKLSAMAAELAARAKLPPGDTAPPQTRPASEPLENGNPMPAVSEPLVSQPAATAPAASPADTPPPAQTGEREPSAMPTPARSGERPGPAASVEQQPLAESSDVELERPPPSALAARPAPAPSEATPPPAQAEAAPAVSEPGAGVAARVRHSGDNVILEFPFSRATPAAVFGRGDVLWLIFGSEEPIALAELQSEIGRTIKSVTKTRTRDAELLRLKLIRPMLVSANTAGTTWNVTIGPGVTELAQPLRLSRNLVGAGRSSVTVALEDPRELYRIEDPDAGDTLLVATALAPTRGVLKEQDFVEFRVLTSTHGLVVQPLADDLNAELSSDKVIITRPTGLTLSAITQGNTRASASRGALLDAQTWGFDGQAVFADRNSQLLNAAADAPQSKRLLARTDLARFYLARDMLYEAKAILDVAIADQPPTAGNTAAMVLRAACNIMIGRAETGLKDLASSLVGNQDDVRLWRALAYAKLGKWAQARESFRNAESAIGILPIELQRAVMQEMIRAAIEVGDITGAVTQLNEFEAIGIPREIEPTMALLTGRINEKLGRLQDAHSAYQTAIASSDRPASAQAQLRDIVLRRSIGKIKREDAVAELETLATIWRGDATEIEALQMLGRAYTDEGRYRDAFQIMHTAISVQPNSETTHRIQEEAVSTFNSLFLAGKGDTLPAIDALAMFYDFRDLTPIGRRGDEMIRRLVDRLVSVDLLNQAADLLKYQVERRLQGAARAQVAARLAAIYLMDGKPDRALAALQSTRTSELSNDLRNQRLMLEGRALSESGRHDVALEVVANIPGPEAIRLRSDIYWAAKRWAKAAEQIEILYGERWRRFEPLSDRERFDILRAAVGYSLGNDTLGLARFREKYAAKMGDGPNRRAFDVVTSWAGATDGEFSEVERALRAADTLENFLRDLRARYPDLGTMPSRQANVLDRPATGQRKSG